MKQINKSADPKISNLQENKEHIHNTRNELSGQFEPTWAIRNDHGTPSIDKIAARLNSMHTNQRANVLLALQQTHGNRYVQRLADEMKLMKYPEAQDAGVSDRSQQIECMRRLGGCPETRPGGFPTDEEIVAYNEECRSETGYTGPQLRQEDLLCGGQEEIAPNLPPNPPVAPAEPVPLHVAGREQPDQPYKIIRLGWTLDDGPTEFTGSMRQSLGPRGGTWFIQRSQLGQGDELQRRLTNLVELQNQQQNEIAIHSMHPTVNHGSWFPVNVSIHVSKVYDSIEQAMQHLTDFVGLLRGAGLAIHFVRLPGGLITEMNAYLGSVGVEASRQNSIADQIIRGENISGSAPAALPVQRDYQIMQSTLSQLGLYLWGGGSGSQITQRQSWEAESSGSGLTDDVTARFNRLVDAFSNVHRPRSMIVLAHDNNRVNAEEVARDIRSMETYAENHGVRVEYYTLSSLFRVVRGVEP